MEVALAALAAALLTVAITGALLYVAYRRVLRRHLVDEVLRVSGPSIVQALPPQQVMTTLLSKIYGDGQDNLDVVAGVLGGEGSEPHGTDLTISTHTTLDYELRAVDAETFELISTVTHSFQKNVADHRFVIFATCSPLLRDSIALACRLPLFESWFVPDPTRFEKSVDAMVASVQIGIRYTDLHSGDHDVPPWKVELSEVGYREWPEFLKFFREPLGTMPRQDPARYMDTLRIFECDLGELTSVYHTVSSVEHLSFRSTTLGSVADGFCFWQAPYPCYAERISFNVGELAADQYSSWVFQVVPFTFRSTVATGGWVPEAKLDDLDVRSWLLPGHGVALLWKPAEHDDTISSDEIGEMRHPDTA